MMSRWGWESIFYFHGALTSVWFVFWMLFVSNTPSSHRLISDKEKLFITAALSLEKKHEVLSHFFLHARCPQYFPIVAKC